MASSKHCRLAFVRILPLLFAVLANFVGEISATCSTTQFDNCVSGLPVDLPCTLSEFDSYCSLYTTARHCIDNINCADGDLGYSTVTNFGSFSNYVTKRNAIDSNLVFCTSKDVLSSQSPCVLNDPNNQYIPELQLTPPNLNAVSWVGDHCGFLNAYYAHRQKKFEKVFNAEVAQIVVNALLKRYELQQLNCPSYGGSLPYNETNTDKCFDQFNNNISSSACSAGTLDQYCSLFTSVGTCIANLGLTTWALSYIDMPPVFGRYVPYTHYYRDYIGSYLYVCNYKSVIQTSCIFDDAIIRNFIPAGGNTNYSTFDEFCSIYRQSFDSLYTSLRSNYSEDIGRIMVTYFKMYTNFYGCADNASTISTTIAVINVPANTASTIIGLSGTTSSGGISKHTTISADGTTMSNNISRSTMFTSRPTVTTVGLHGTTGSNNNRSEDVTSLSGGNSRPTMVSADGATTSKNNDNNKNRSEDVRSFLPLILSAVTSALVFVLAGHAA